MKIRIGYVSNSSSSSYIVYGRKIDLREAVELMDERHVICVVPGAGTSGDAADFVFRMMSGRMKHLKGTNLGDKAYYIDVMHEFDCDDCGMVVVGKRLEGGRTFDIDKDESSPLSDFPESSDFVEWCQWMKKRKTR